MTYNPLPIEGKQHQIREMMYNRIVSAFPSKANSPDLLYGDIEALYYEYLNEGLLVETGLPSRLSDETLQNTFIKPLAKSTIGNLSPMTYINVNDFGAVGNNTGDQTAAIQAAIDAAGSGGVVRLAHGAVYRCTSGLTVPAWTTIEASSSSFGAGGTSPTEIVFVIEGTTVAMTLGTYATLRNVKLRGPGTAVGTCIGVAGASLTLDHTSIINFFTGVHLTAGYYSRFEFCEWSRNGTSLKLTDCYNVNIIASQFFCGSTVDNSPGTAISGAARGLNIYGGAIEHYQYGITLSSAQVLGLYGVYFETTVSANAYGVKANALDNITINAIGCMVYLNGTYAWIDVSGSTDCTLSAHGNHFASATTSVQAAIAYILGHEQANTIGPDNWAEVLKTGSAYVSVSSGTLPARGSTITMPIGWTNGPNVYEGRRRLDGFNLQTLSTAGAVTLDSRYLKHVVSLTANATSSLISNVSNVAQELEITWMQDATGGRTYAWPTSCNFAGSTAPSDTTANTQTTVAFRYNTSTGRWVERFRAVAVPN